MVKALFDSNVLIDHLGGVAQAHEEFQRYLDRAISRITWLEVLAGVAPGDQAGVRMLLNQFEIIELTSDVAEIAVEIRRDRRIKAPDAIIAASALHTGRLLVTRNEKDFPASDPGVRIPYRLN